MLLLDLAQMRNFKMDFEGVNQLTTGNEKIFQVLLFDFEIYREYMFFTMQIFS